MPWARRCLERSQPGASMPCLALWVSRDFRRHSGEAGSVALLAEASSKPSRSLLQAAPHHRSPQPSPSPPAWVSCCVAGYKVKTDCAGEAETVCEPCGPHYFQGAWTQEKHCTPHRDCDESRWPVIEGLLWAGLTGTAKGLPGHVSLSPTALHVSLFPPDAGLEVEIPGDMTQNFVCRCKKGTHCSSQECQTCRVNKPCGPGEGVQQEGGEGWRTHSPTHERV